MENVPWICTLVYSPLETKPPPPFPIPLMNMLHQFIKFQTHFGMSKASKMGLALNEMRYIAIHSNVNTIFKHAPQVERNGSFCIQDNQWKYRGLTPNKEFQELKAQGMESSLEM